MQREGLPVVHSTVPNPPMPCPQNRVNRHFQAERPNPLWVADFTCVSIRYSEHLAEAGIEPSAGHKGDRYDNPLAETINALYKAEVTIDAAPGKPLKRLN